MTAFLITLAIFAIFKHIARKPQKRSYSTVSPAEIQRQQKAREKAIQDAERAAKRERIEAERARKKDAEKAQAEIDKLFLVEQIDKLYSQLWEADAELQKARQNCEWDLEIERRGGTVKEKDISRHRQAREKLERRVMQLENSIHAKEAKLNKAQFIAAN